MDYPFVHLRLVACGIFHNHDESWVAEMIFQSYELNAKAARLYHILPFTERTEL